MTKEEIIDNIARLNSETWRDREEVRTEIGKLLSELKKALEQQPSDDEITIIMKKGTLKYSGQGYVAYKKDWFRKHFATEIEIMTYFDVYRKEHEKTKSSVPLSEIYRVIAGHSDYHGDNILAALTCIAEGKEVDTVKPLSQPTSNDCVSRQAVIDMTGLSKWFESSDDYNSFIEDLCKLPPVTPTEKKDDWIPLVWDEYPTVDSDGNDDYVYAVDYFVPMPNEDEWVLITDENHNVRTVRYDGYDFGDYVREEILAWKHSPNPYIE